MQDQGVERQTNVLSPIVMMSRLAFRQSAKCLDSIRCKEDVSGAASRCCRNQAVSKPRELQ